MSNNFSAFVIVLAGFFMMVTSCQSDKDKNIPDVSAVEVPIKIHRFDEAFFAIDTNRTAAGVQELEEKYPEFTDFYLSRILQVKKPWDTVGDYRNYVRGFLTYPFVRQLHHAVDSVYHDFSMVKKELHQGLQFYHHYFPDRPIPEFYTFVSEFSYGIVLPPKGNAIGIGLDFFLGKDFKYYYFAPLNLPRYVARTQDKTHLSTKIFKGIVEDLTGTVEGGRFIDHIIHNGKKLYLLDQLLPYQQDSIKLNYTARQVEWCEANELEIWAFFLQEELMYSNDFQQFKTLVTLSPKSAGLPDIAPGEVGNWMGWQIVKAYMNRHPETTLQELIAMNDPQVILDQSRYKPGR